MNCLLLQRLRVFHLTVGGHANEIMIDHKGKGVEDNAAVCGCFSEVSNQTELNLSGLLPILLEVTLRMTITKNKMLRTMAQMMQERMAVLQFQVDDDYY